MTATEDAGDTVSMSGPTPGRDGNRILLSVLGAALAGLFVFAVLRLVVSGVFGVDGNRYTAAALALAPFAVPFGVVLAVLAFLGRQRLIGVASALLTLALAVPLLPRVVVDGGPAADGPGLRVLAFNTYFGEAEARRVVDLVAEHRVDVLVLTELETDMVRALTDAGLPELLPHRISRPGAGGVGSALISRYPLTGADLAGPSTFEQPGARMRVDGVTVEVVAVHPVPPVTDARTWRSELGALPEADPDGAVRVLAGDFNATADHAAFRDLVATGYVDAAEQRGRALVPTWPRDRFGPPVTLDHVLVDTRATVDHYSTHDIPGSDHRAVLAHLRLPTPTAGVP
ncbi:endonuclease/exonuclease/phosphatase family protein [Saccharomonospora iraqiensis]|uniref:endonuclease/exonuclease/phosphatase family protein n=1 Tax=Saccharomonospora iraqiensis TaxID=52698 RepID=UPI000421FCB2|nr:endonuclease/exonuclease/phosphatase family protein [Saccharomonospora iraqiensis]